MGYLLQIKLVVPCKSQKSKKGRIFTKLNKKGLYLLNSHDSHVFVSKFLFIQ